MTFRRRTISGLEVALLNCEGHSFPKHAHDEFVLGVNLVGREHIWLDGKSLEAEHDELTLYNPGQVQAGNARNYPWTFISIYCESGWVQSVLGRATETWFDRPIARSTYYAKKLRHFGLTALENTYDNNELLEAGTGLVSELIDAFGSTTNRRISNTDSRMKLIADLLLELRGDPPTLASLASTAGMSAVQLVRCFSSTFGLPPFQWLNCKKLQLARQKLRQGTKLSDVAFDLGFADQPHFTRRFKAMYGTSPGSFAKVK